MRITFFLGRIHHAHKLLGVAAALNQSGAEIDILIADNSINIDPTTEYLHKFGVNVFYHAKDYMVQSDADIDFSWFKKDLLKYFPPFWLLSSYKEATECITGFSGYLKDREPTAVFALHENNFWVRTLFYLAQKNDIMTYSLQEGIILEREEEILKKYSTGTNYTDILFSWSKHDKDYYSSDAKIVPVGPAHMDRYIALVNDKSAYSEAKTTLRAQMGFQNKRVLVFAPPRLDLYAGDFVKAVNALAKWTMNNNFGMVVKLHPFQSGVDSIKEMLGKYTHVTVSNDSDSLQFVVVADVLITQTSTIAIEAAILGVPVAELDMDYIGLDQTINQQGGARLIEGNNLDEITHLISYDSRTNTLDELKQHRFIKDYFPLADGKSTQRIVDYVKAGQWIK